MEKATRPGGRVVLVTGAAHGIGLGVAEAFAALGDAVALADVNAAGTERAADEIAGRFGVGTLPLAFDVRDAAAVEAAVARVLERFGRIDVLVNNAGIYPNTPVLEMDEAEWDAVFDTNVKGIFLVSRAVGRAMVARGEGGRIVNISSGAARSARRGAGHYCSSKSAVEMFTRVLAIELGPERITVNCVAPGFVVVPDADMKPEYVAGILAGVPTGRLGEPADIANGVVFLAAPEAHWITGTILAIDGGSMAGRAALPFSSKSR